MTLASVGLGGVVGYGGTLLTHFVTRRDRRLTRWDEARVSAYFEFAAALKAEIRTCDRIASGKGYRTDASPLTVQEGMERLAHESDRRTMLLEQVLLIGSQQTASAARAWQNAAVALHEALRDSSQDAKRMYLTAFAAAGHARDAFYVAARRELQVSGGTTALQGDPAAPGS